MPKMVLHGRGEGTGPESPRYPPQIGHTDVSQLEAEIILLQNNFSG